MTSLSFWQRLRRARTKRYEEHASDTLISRVPLDAKRILDLGCSAGLLGKKLKSRQNCEVWGVDYSRESIKTALKRLDKAIVGDLEQIDQLDLPLRYFDCIILADVLEHLRDPWTLLAQVKRYLRRQGLVVASIPNVQHAAVSVPLLFGSWEYDESGLLDKTHLRFFTRTGAINLFESSGYHVSKVYRNFSDRPWLARLLKVCSLVLVANFFTLQYQVIATPKKKS